MTFLPVVQRELRAASQRKSTYRVRWWTALIALGITLLASAATVLSRGPRGAGGSIFDVLTGYALFLCLLSGVLFTADALAQEKREGTLGLLFLTDLKGYDIVLGKFFARSLNAFYALLAILPAAALPLLLGGLEGAEFFRMALALINALCVSAAAGIFVSALSRQSQTALSSGLGLVILLSAILPLTVAGLQWIGAAPAWQRLAWISPFFAYAHSEAASYAVGGGDFWAALGLSHLSAWVLLGTGSLVLPRAFRDKPKLAQARGGARPGTVSTPKRTASRELLSQNPILWLRSSELGTPWAAWMVVGLWGLAAAVIFAVDPGSGRSSGQGITSVHVQSARIFGFFLKLLFALHVCRFFMDARRDGTLELLLCTPLSDQDIIQGQMKAVWRCYRWLFYLLLILLALPVMANLVVVGILEPLSTSFYTVAGAAFQTGAFVLRLAADVFAILWFGTGLALTSKRPSLAPAWTVLFVLILPSPLSYNCWLDILIDLVLISWGTNKCRLDLRRLVTGQYQALVQAPRLAYAKPAPLSHKPL